ncbi:MAG: hypothetical protein HC880_03240 [Bacteroidia bacterium]|nr:hypothetical protein [Bacteroidia bacterium]
MLWVIIAIAGAGLDLAAVGSTVKATLQTMRPAVKALDATGDVAKFEEAMKAIATKGEIEQRMAQQVIEANKARAAANEASQGFFKAITGKAYSFPGPFTDPDVYPHLVKFAYFKVKEGISDFLTFVDKVKLARIEAKLGAMTPEEMAKVKQAWEAAKGLSTLYTDTGSKLKTLIGDDKIVAKIVTTIEHSGEEGSVLASRIIKGDFEGVDGYAALIKKASVDEHSLKTVNQTLSKAEDALKAGHSESLFRFEHDLGTGRHDVDFGIKRASGTGYEEAHQFKILDGKLTPKKIQGASVQLSDVEASRKIVELRCPDTELSELSDTNGICPHRNSSKPSPNSRTSSR